MNDYTQARESRFGERMLQAGVVLASIALVLFITQFAAQPFSDDAAEYEITLQDGFQH